MRIGDVVNRSSRVRRQDHVRVLIHPEESLATEHVGVSLGVAQPMNQRAEVVLERVVLLDTILQEVRVTDHVISNVLRNQNLIRAVNSVGSEV